MKKFEGDAKILPLNDVLKALGYATNPCRHHNPSLGLKEIYRAEPGKNLIAEDDILFVGRASETWDWLVETGQIDGKKELNYSVLKECPNKEV
jgi:hypothetical protein